jgi:adenylosuccinate synthase
MLRHAVRLNSLTEWAITKLDVLDTFDVIKVCVAYKVNGKEISGYPDTIDALAEVEPVYVEIPGWKRSLAGVTRESDLPPSAIALIKLIEEHTKIPVTLVGTGAGRDDLLVRE